MYHDNIITDMNNKTGIGIINKILIECNSKVLSKVTADECYILLEMWLSFRFLNPTQRFGKDEKVNMRIDMDTMYKTENNDLMIMSGEDEMVEVLLYSSRLTSEKYMLITGCDIGKLEVEIKSDDDKDITSLQILRSHVRGIITWLRQKTAEQLRMNIRITRIPTSVINIEMIDGNTLNITLSYNEDYIDAIRATYYKYTNRMEEFVYNRTIQFTISTMSQLFTLCECSEYNKQAIKLALNTNKYGYFSGMYDYQKYVLGRAETLDAREQQYVDNIKQKIDNVRRFKESSDGKIAGALKLLVRLIVLMACCVIKIKKILTQIGSVIVITIRKAWTAMKKIMT